MNGRMWIEYENVKISGHYAVRVRRNYVQVERHR